ncbi:MAG: GNAT family N-acetyltransferase [Deltaproteobacteria bacterium]
MRRAEFAMPHEQALAFLAAQPVVRLAGATSDGEPILRTLNTVVHDGWLAFHSAPKGEKTGLLGTKVVASADETVAVIPSTFLGPERACDATTLYQSVQAHGVLEAIESPDAKAAILQALMEKLQPGGGYAPIDADHPRYRSAVKGLLIAGIRLTRVDGKAKLAQNRTADERVRLLDALWLRGAPGDLRAIELIRSANPGTPPPAILTAPAGTTMHCHLEPGDAREAAALLAGAYWNDRFTLADLELAHTGCQAWVGARDDEGRLIATARAVSDGGKYAWVYDVFVTEARRGIGLGKALMRAMLAHPAVRPARRVMLGTRDAQGLYAGFGFVPTGSLPRRPYVSTEAVLVRRDD